MKYIQRIANSNQAIRKQAILSILTENNIPYTTQKVLQGERWVENIIVSCNPSSSRLVIGAHYDSVEGSTGANDNASGVSVLIRVLLKMFSKTSYSVDFVFFDSEECRDKGSQAYIAQVGKDTISAMINLDVCGVGERIAISDKGNKHNPLFAHLFDKAILERHDVCILDFLPNGDDTIFQANNIPNISIAVLNDSDIMCFKELGIKLNNHEELTEADAKKVMSLDIASTMHLGVNDTISSISQHSMDRVVDYLIDGLSNV